MTFFSGALRSVLGQVCGGPLSRAAAAAAAAAIAATASTVVWGPEASADARAASPADTARPTASNATAVLPSAPDSPASTSSSAAASVSCRLPTSKLSCKLRSAAPHRPVVLVSCGSFNPPTVLHMRMVDLAAEELLRRGYDVWGAYLSPVADAYGKKGLAPAADRIAMCRLAAAETEAQASVATAAAAAAAAAAAEIGSKGVAASKDEIGPKFRLRNNPEMDLVMVHDWEARQPGYTRTLAVLRRVESELKEWLLEAGPSVGQEPSNSGSGSDVAAQKRRQEAPQAQAQQQEQQPEVRAMLLCGGDVLASMASPGVWRDPDVILREHGVVCVDREGTDLEALLDKPGNVLYDNRDRIVLVYDKVGNSVSSSKVRQELAAGRPVWYLVPAGVLSYIYEKELYGAGRAEGESRG